MRISIILVNWNNASDTLKCLESLIAGTQQHENIISQIVIVDNASTDDSPERLKQAEHVSSKSFLTVLYSEENNGLAAGYNIGIRYCLDRFTPDAIWLLNNDTTIDPYCLDKLVEAMQQYPQCKIWGSTIYTMDGSELHCAGGFKYHAALSLPVPIRFAPKDVPSTRYHPLPQMDYVSGISMCVRAECFRQHGLLDEGYFLYYEELEMVRQFGGKQYIAWCPESVVYHKGGGSTASRNPNIGQGSYIAHYYGNRSALIYTMRHHPWFFPFVFVFRLIAKSALFIRYRDWAGFKPLLHAYADYLTGRKRGKREDVRA